MNIFPHKNSKRYPAIQIFFVLIALSIAFSVRMFVLQRADQQLAAAILMTAHHSLDSITHIAESGGTSGSPVGNLSATSLVTKATSDTEMLPLGNGLSLYFLLPHPSDPGIIAEVVDVLIARMLAKIQTH